MIFVGCKPISGWQYSTRQCKPHREFSALRRSKTEAAASPALESE